MSWNIAEQSHEFIYDVAWNILGQRVLYKLALFTLNILNLMTVIYALILFLSIISDVRLTKKVAGLWQKLGGGRGGGGGGGGGGKHGFLPPNITSFPPFLLLRETLPEAKSSRSG